MLWCYSSVQTRIFAQFGFILSHEHVFFGIVGVIKASWIMEYFYSRANLWDWIVGRCLFVLLGYGFLVVGESLFCRKQAKIFSSGFTHPQDPLTLFLWLCIIGV